jgi:hypothetical protein
MASEDPGFALAAWQPYSTAPKFRLSDGAGDKTVYFKVRNSFDESPPANDSISATGLAPVLTSFKINAGKGSTAKGLVTLNNTATNFPMYYMASELSNFSDATWQKYSTAPKFVLSDGGRMKKIYFKVQNIFGESGVLSDTIITNGLPPEVTSLKINAGAANTVNALVTLNNTAAELPVYYMASEDPIFGGASWQLYSAAPKFTLSAGSGTKTVYFKLSNGFGESSVVSDTIFLY